LATVRNSLRASLYQTSAPAQALTTLNTMLTVHELLNGFVTLFVGVYDPATATLTYSTCGHEPVLLRREHDNSVELLRTRGLPLGTDANAAYTQNSVHLNVADALMFFTDGLSEAGPSRKEMMEIEGVIRLFEGMEDFSDLDKSATSIMAEVKNYANGILRDDVCILLAYREGDKPQVSKELELAGNHAT
jgi:serine phosphatase RsbU (regulator of sigma subunit)